MMNEFEGDLAGAVFWGADLTGARFRDVNLTGARVSHAWLVDVDIDATIDRLVINGVDVTDYVNERDPWHPLRSMILADQPDTIREAWALLRSEWAATISQAGALPDADVHRSVDGEWSFAQTLRHLVFAIDKWITVPVLGGGYHPIGLPNSGSVDFPWPGLDQAADPTTDEVLAAHASRVAQFDELVASVGPDDLGREIDVPENGPHTLRDCISTILEEGFWHLRYARRDLGAITGGSPG